jgi:hypothetical protein
MLPHDHAAAGGDGYLSSFQSDIELLINLLEQTPGQAAQRTDESLPETAAALPMPDNAPVASQPTSQPAEAWQEAEDDGPLDMEKTLLSAMSADMPPPDIPSAPTATGTHQNAAAPERAPRPPRVPSPQPARQERLVMRVVWLESEITAMHRQLDNRDELIAMVAPVISLIIAERVRESRDEMAEALYPVIGKTIGKAVTEALRELARRVDTTVRSKTNVKQAFQWWRMRMQGVDPQASALRALLPFSVQEIFLIHTESGLLIHHISNTNTLTDADLISGMLTAIRSYVKDSFAYKDGSLDEITYGDFRILMEDGTLAILAIVIQGNEPANFREHMRTQLTELHLMCSSTLRDFTGDPVDEEKVMPFLKPLLESPDDTA